MWQFVHYNTVLRRWPVNIFESLNGNTYATTIHCLVSGVTKVSRRTRIPSGLVLYRGFGGLKLPEQFYKAPEGGFKGFVEWGFMVGAAKRFRTQSHSISLFQGRSFLKFSLITRPLLFFCIFCFGASAACALVIFEFRELLSRC